MSFGKTVKKLRLEASLTQERMTELLSFSPHEYDAPN